MPAKKKIVKGKTKTNSNPKNKDVKPKLQLLKERFIPRPDAEQLAILEKAIYHSFKSTFTGDATGASKLLFDGEPVKSATGDQLDLKDFFKLIVKSYSTL